MINEEQKKDIEYFMGWEVGDNITVTADFVAYAEELNKLKGE